MRLIEQVWFHNHRAKWWLVPLLLPLSCLFMLLTALRRLLYRLNITKAIESGLPVIIVGNIGIGGNGKTPLTIHLLALCDRLGIKAGVISRGYGGILPDNKHYPLLIDDHTPVEQTGDEPFLIYHRCKVPVAVGPDRIASVSLLKAQGCQLIIADDGLQHYRLQRTREIIVVDGKRGFGNGFLLPAGPLREGQWRLNTVDSIVVNGDTSLAITKPYQQMMLAASYVINIKTGEKVSLEAFKNAHSLINAAAGIGSPQRFFDTLTSNGFSLDKTAAFVDHHHFSKLDFADFSSHIPLLMTEKDAVKCQAFGQDNWWYLEVSAQFSEQDNQLFNDMLSKLTSVG